MIINGIKLNVDHTQDDLYRAVCKKTGYKKHKYRILKKSVDARFNNVNFVYNIEACDEKEELPTIKRLEIPKSKLDFRPIVAGFGPSGMFAAYILALAGAKPIVLERGKCVDKRVEDVNNFWNNRKLNINSNVQFGEGGAGTFSDGKLTTNISDALCREVLHTFVDCGANEEILYLSKPHLGTDNLVKIVKNMRNKIIELGGEILFENQLIGLEIVDNKLIKVKANDNFFETKALVLALGHSARDTFKMLYESNLNMEPKPFSVGVRIEHLQSDVNKCQYGNFFESPYLGAADYKASYHTESGRGVYTFCMCPGGVIVGATSVENAVVTNGMSYYNRDKTNANSAFLVSVTPEDFGKQPLDGMYFQEKIERKAFEMAGNSYNAPCQLLGDFLNNKVSTSFESIKPTYMPGVTFSNLRNLFPEYITDSMIQAVDHFSKKLKFFKNSDAVLTAPETRSSSPVRIVRNEKLESNISGIYPCGEGAGYAGGIMSAAVDGIKCAMAVLNNKGD